MNSKKIVLVTGATSGIGEEIAKQLQSEDFIIYGGGRNKAKLETLLQHNIKPIEIDITNDASIENAVSEILRKEHRIDVLINNAGYGSYGTVEDIPISEARKQFEVNLFGLARLTQLVLPSMRQNNFGKIINISSMGGRIYTPAGAWYYATKHALEVFSDCLRLEVKDFGIDVIIIQPGVIKTNWHNIAMDKLLETSANGPYEKFASSIEKNFKWFYENKYFASDPKVIAAEVSRALKANNPRIRYPAPLDAQLSIFFKWLLPDEIYDFILMKILSR